MTISVIALHVLVLGALMEVRFVREEVGDAAPIVVDFIVPPTKREVTPPPPPAPPEPVQSPPPQPAPPEPLTEVQAPKPVKAPTPPKPVATVKPNRVKSKPVFVAPPPSTTQDPVARPEPQPVPPPVPKAEPLPPPAPVVEAHAPPAEPAAAPAPKEMSIRAVSYLAPPVLKYPALSRRMQEQGRVDVRVLVDAQGLPRETQLARSSGYPRLDESALATARATRFKPYLQNGVPMPFWVVMPMIFELRN